MPELLATSLPEYIAAGLKEVAQEQGFTEGLYRLESESGSNMGDGFVGQLLKVFIREADRELVVLCKLLPESEMRKQQGIPLFDRETVAYMQILPLLTKFQDEKALAKHLPRFENVPRCYYAKTTLDKMESVIIMEDLRLQAYRMWDKANPVDFEHARLLMATLGRLHALSFAMKDQQPEEFAQAIETLDQHDNFRREKLKQIQDRCVQEIVACMDGKAAEPYAIVGHGDCWSNNMMFQYAEDEVAREQGFTEGLYSLENESGSKVGDGFAGDLVKVFIREGDRELVILCKLLPENETRKQQGISLFARETEAYMKILPLLLKFQDEKALPVHLPRFDNVPRCYYAKTTLDSMESVVIMEDLRMQAYRMWDKANPVDFEHARLLMATLGRLHALSFAMKDQQPEEFAQCREFTDPMTKMLALDPKKTFPKMAASMCRRAIDTLEKDDTYRRGKLELLQDRCVQEIEACVDANGAEPYANQTPSKIKLIDWQLSRYGSPVLDLVYFIFNCTDEEMRSHSYQRLLSIYYHSLSEHLHNLGGDVERQYPRIAFREQLNKFGRYGLLIAMLIMPMICTPNDELPDTNKAMEGLVKENPDGDDEVHFEYGTTEKAAIRYQKRMSGCIRDMVPKEEGFAPEQFSVQYEPGSKSGDGYIGLIVRARFISSVQPTLSVICKFPPEDRQQRERFNAMLLFERELFIYQHVLPAFEELQLQHGIDRKDETYFGNYPKCYHAYCDSDRGEAVLILEDLLAHQRPPMKLLDQYVPVDYDHVRVLMEALGRFNACSFALKHHRPEMFEKLRQLNDLLSVVLDTEQTRPLTPRN
uniref:CHK kinase-like domain-containing protein n=1 Tax=Anopheles melas TaxID=34690 RepID=A0A182TQB9_9DIPT